MHGEVKRGQCHTAIQCVWRTGPGDARLTCLDATQQWLCSTLKKTLQPGINGFTNWWPVELGQLAPVHILTTCNNTLERNSHKGQINRFNNYISYIIILGKESSGVSRLQPRQYCACECRGISTVTPDQK